MNEIIRGEIIYWFKHIMHKKQIGMSVMNYCRKYDLDDKKFANIRYRLIYSGGREKNDYNEKIELGRLYLNGDLTKAQFCEGFKIEPGVLSTIILHIQYTDIIKEEFGEDYMNIVVDSNDPMLLREDLKMPRSYTGKFNQPPKKPENDTPLFFHRPKIIADPEPQAQMKPVQDLPPVNLAAEPVALEVPATVPREMLPKPPEPILESKNDIELIIAVGVKVSVSPEVSSQKLIQIISFLRSL